MLELKFTVPGTPHPKGRARACIRGGKIAHYTPKKTGLYEEQVRLSAALEICNLGIEPLVDAVSVSIEACFAPPTSWGKEKKRAALSGEIMPTSKPDIDNVAKAILDGLNGVAFLDDAQVVQISISKRYADAACANIIISQVGGAK